MRFSFCDNNGAFWFFIKAKFIVENCENTNWCYSMLNTLPTSLLLALLMNGCTIMTIIIGCVTVYNGSENLIQSWISINKFRQLEGILLKRRAIS